MKRLAVIAALLVVLPAAGNAQMDCVACHDIHNSAGGTLNTADEFDLICATCHGPAGTDPDGAGTEYPTFETPNWNASANLDCGRCHSWQAGAGLSPRTGLRYRFAGNRHCCS